MAAQPTLERPLKCGVQPHSQVKGELSQRLLLRRIYPLRKQESLLHQSIYNTRPLEATSNFTDNKEKRN